MAVSVTQICNIALADIGDKRITDIAENTPQARFCRAHYETTRDKVLRVHPWNFATTQAALSELTDPPLAGFCHRYALPGDFLRVVQLNGFEAWEARDDFKVVGRELHTDADAAVIEYVQRVTDSSIFDALFVELLAKLLASKLAAPLAGDRSLGLTLRSEYQAMLGEARMTDANEARPKVRLPMVESAFIASRYSSDIA